MKMALEQDRRQKTDTKPEKMDNNCKQDADTAAETEPSDDAIIERICNGDINAFEILARRYERWVCGIVAKRMPHDQVAEIAQEVFIHAYQSLPHYSPRQRLAADGHLNSSFKQWLARIAVRRCCDYQRDASRHSTCAISNLSAEDREQMEQTCQATACEMFQAEMGQETTREALLQAMDGLGDDDRIILGLIYGQGYSLRETANMLGESIGSVSAHACRARALLRHRLSSAEPNRQLLPA